MIAAALAAEAQGPSLPSWMAGCWETHSNGVWVEECWTRPRAGIMLGTGRSGKGEKLFNWEVMQIVRSATNDPAGPRLTFYGAPSGKDRTPFHWLRAATETSPSLTQSTISRSASAIGARRDLVAEIR